jgi:catechol 2,3-dioxygenase-like lactoylglutathione lyase family enzyme
MAVSDRAAPRLAGIFGVKFPVRDLAASRDWYEKVFGLTLEFEFPDDDGVVRGVAYSAPGLGDVGVALRERPDIAGCCSTTPTAWRSTSTAGTAATWTTRADPATGAR